MKSTKRERLLVLLLSLLMVFTTMPTMSLAVEDMEAEEGTAQTVEETADVEETAESELPAVDAQENSEEAAPAEDPAAAEAPAEETAAPEATAPAKEQEAPAVKAEETAAPAPKAEKSKYPAMILRTTVNGVVITLTAPEGSLPEEVSLRALPVQEDFVYEAVQKEFAKEGETLQDLVAFDIAPVDEHGEEIQPLRPVSVSFQNTALELDSGSDIRVFRVSDDASKATEMRSGITTASEQQFSTDHFTIYVSGGGVDDPNHDGKGPNTADHPLEVAYDAEVTLEASTSSSTWAVDQGSGVTIQSSTATSAVIKNTNTTDEPQIVRIRHHRSSSSSREYYYIRALPQVKHTVSFKLKDAGADEFVSVKEDSVVDGGNATAPTEAASKTVDDSTYEFSGWFEDEDCSIPATLTNITEDETFYAKYIPKDHKVFFKLKDAGASDFVTVKDDPVADGGEAVAPEEAESKTVGGKQYNFSGWFEDEDCSVPATLTNITAAKTVYAKYTLARHSVTFMFRDWDKDSFTQVAVINVDSGSAVSDPPSYTEEITQEGTDYQFSGWCSDESCSTPDPLTNITKDTVVYGRYSPEVTLTYAKHSDHHTATVPASVKAPAGSKVTLGSANYENHIFVGWNTEAEGGGSSYAPGADYTMPEQDVTLYAQWSTGTITVSYYDNYSGSSDPFHEDEDVAQNNPHYSIISGYPDRTGYLFQGWATSSTGDVVYEPGDDCSTGTTDIELYAKWSAVAVEDLTIQELRAKGTTLPYNGTVQSISGVQDEEIYHWDKYLDIGYVRVTHMEGDDQYHNIYAFVGIDGVDISASRKNVGKSSTPITAPLWSHNSQTGVWRDLNEGISIKNTTLEITPLKLTISTKSAEKACDGTPLTAGGTVQVGDGPEQSFSPEGTEIELVGGEKVKIAATGSQTAAGSSANGYLIYWDEAAEGVEEDNYSVEVKATGTLTVYNELTFDPSTEDEVKGMPSDQKVSDSKCDLPEDEPTRDFYDFKGWTDVEGGSSAKYQPGDEYTFTGQGGDTLYAVWEEDPVDISFDKHTEDEVKGMPDPMESMTIDFYMPEEEPERAFYDFLGWTDVEGGTTADYHPGDEVHLNEQEIEAGKAIFYAIWEENPVEINFDKNTEDEVKDMPEGMELMKEGYRLPDNRPSREGYSFLGWAADPNAKTPQYQPGDTAQLTEEDIQRGSLTLYPVWEMDEIIYSNTAGDGNVWIKGSGETSDFTFERSKNDEETFQHFVGILVDDIDVDQDKYTAEPGSVIIKLKPEYLETLDLGEHSITAIFEDGNHQASAKFTIQEEVVTDEPEGEPEDNDTPAPKEKPGKVTPVKETNAKTGDLALSFLLYIMLGAALLLLSSHYIRKRDAL